MKIFIVGSMQFSEQMVAMRQKLEALGHLVTLSSFVERFLGKTDEEKERIKIEQKNQEDAMRVDCARIVGQDAVLALNLDKDGIKNYIGGNALIELGYAHILGQRIFLLNPIPEIPFYKSELEAMAPTILHGDINQISLYHGEQ